mmetsp:Transcript_40803/g.87024  ORF Transcript_40803/g.87024 Transcript_40803/m.87024 type:complete len:282 (-) Transcript_40803:46-891(-)
MYDASLHLVARFQECCCLLCLSCRLGHRQLLLDLAELSAQLLEDVGPLAARERALIDHRLQLLLQPRLLLREDVCIDRVVPRLVVFIQQFHGHQPLLQLADARLAAPQHLEGPLLLREGDGLRSDHRLERILLGVDQQLGGAHRVGVGVSRARGGRRVNAREDMHKLEVLVSIVLVLEEALTVESGRGTTVFHEADPLERIRQNLRQLVVVLLSNLLATTDDERDPDHLLEWEWYVQSLLHECRQRCHARDASEVDLCRCIRRSHLRSKLLRFILLGHSWS